MAYRSLNSFQIRQTWPSSWGTADAKLVIALDREIVSSDGVQYEGAKIGTSSLKSLGFYWSSAITIVNGLATAAGIANLPTTDTATPAHTARYYIYIYVKGHLKEKLGEGRGFHLHESINGASTTFTWYQWVNAQQWKQGSSQLPMIADRVTVQAMIDAASQQNASDTVSGITRLSVAPVSEPIAVGDNDPRVNSVLNVKEARFGAIADGTSHPLSERFSTLAEAQAFYPRALALSEEIDRHAIQKALDTITSYYPQAGVGGTVLLPASDAADRNLGWGYMIDWPLYMEKPQQCLRGESVLFPAQLLATPSFPDGGAYMIMVAPPTGELPIETQPFNYLPIVSRTTALLTGTGYAYPLDAGGTRMINFRDLLTAEINGLTAITIEFSFKMTANITDGSGMIMCCMGNRLNEEPTSETFSIRVDGSSGGGYSNRLKARLNVNGTVKELLSASGAVTLNTVHHVALTYDNSNVKLWLDGALIDTEAATGGISQAIWEDWWINGSCNDWPDGQVVDFGITGAIDSVRVSNTVRYTGSYTQPTAKFTFDSDTRILCNFDTFRDQLIGIQHQPSPGVVRMGYSFWRRFGYWGFLGGMRIENLRLEGGSTYGSGGILITQSTNNTIYNVNGTNFRAYINFWNNAFFSICRDVSGSTGGTYRPRFGMAAMNACALMRFERLQIASNSVSFVANGGGVVDDTSFYGGTLYCPAIIKGASGFENWALTNVTYGDEAQTQPTVCGLVLGGTGTISMHSGNLGGTLFNIPPLMIGPACRVSLQGVKFTLIPTTAKAIDFTHPSGPRYPVILNGCEQDFLGNGPYLFKPWTTDPAHSFVVGGSRQVQSLRVGGNNAAITLAVDLNNSSTFLIWLSDVAGLPMSGVVKIDNEYIGYEAHVGGDQNGVAANLVMRLTRGLYGSSAASHTAGAAVELVHLTVENGTTTPNVMSIADRTVFNNKLAVSTSAAATTPGSVVKKVPLYDANGTLLGYIPVYDAIT